MKKYKRIICKKCNGDGDLPGKIDWFSGVFTFGITALLDLDDREMCLVCDGKGFTEVLIDE